MASSGGAWSKGGKFTKNPSRVRAINAARRVEAERNAPRSIVNAVRRRNSA